MKNTNKRPIQLRGGIAIPLKNNLYYIKGKKHSQGGVDVNPDLEVEGGEVVEQKPKEIKVYSSVKFLGGESPANLVMNGFPKDKVFDAQQRYKRVNKINDDGTKKAEIGTKVNGKMIPTVNEFITNKIDSTRNAAYKKSLERTMPSVPMIANTDYDKEKADNYQKEYNNISNYLSKHPLFRSAEDYNKVLNSNLVYSLPNNITDSDLIKDLYNKEKGINYHGKKLCKGLSCIYTATDNYGKQYKTSSNIKFKENPSKFGFKSINNYEARPGDIVQLTVRNRVPIHGVIYDGKDKQGKPLYNYSDGGDTESNIVKHGHFINDNPLSYTFVGTPQDSTRWTNEYKKQYNIKRMGGLSRSKDYGSKSKPYPTVNKNDFAGGNRSYPIPSKADAVDALRLAGLHGRSDVKAKVYKKYPELKNKAKMGSNYILQTNKGNNVRFVSSTGDKVKAKYGTENRKSASLYTIRDINPYFVNTNKRSVKKGKDKKVRNVASYKITDINPYEINKPVITKSSNTKKEKVRNVASYRINDIDPYKINNSNYKTKNNQVNRKTLDNINPDALIDTVNNTIAKRLKDNEFVPYSLRNNEDAEYNVNLPEVSVMGVAPVKKNKSFVSKSNKQEKINARLYKTYGPDRAYEENEMNFNPDEALNNSIKNNTKKIIKKESNNLDNRKPQYYAERRVPMFEDGEAIKRGLIRAGWSHGNNKKLDINIPSIPEIKAKPKTNKVIKKYAPKNPVNKVEYNNRVTPKFTANRPIANPVNKVEYNRGLINKNAINNPINIERQSTKPTRGQIFKYKAKQFFKNKQNVGDTASLLSNTVGGISDLISHNKMLRDLVPPTQPVAKKATKLNTTENTNAKEAKLRELSKEGERQIINNTDSSRKALSRLNRLRLSTLMDYNDIREYKSNNERDLLNRDRLNQQNVANQTIGEYNQWQDRVNAFKNKVTELKADNKVNFVNNINKGIQDTLTKREKRRQFNQNVRAYLASHPNVTEGFLKNRGLEIFG